MKKRNMSKLALMGIASGVLAVSQVSAESQANEVNATILAGKCGAGGCGAHRSQTANRDSSYNSYSADTNSNNVRQLSQEEVDFRAQLNDKTKALFDSLDASAKKIALDFSRSGKYADKNEAVKAAAAQVAPK